MIKTPNIDTDRSFFTVIAQLSNGEVFQPEMDLSWDQKTVLEMARNGQFDTVLRIFETNPAEGWLRDITPDLQEDEEHETTETHDPNHEHRIGNFEAGTGSYGRAA